MEYTKRFASLSELKVFVDFHKEETGLEFSSNPQLKTAWIEVEENVYRDLQNADMFD
jgi:hypothetical protein